MPWSAIVPVKAIGQAKSRLLPADHVARGDLALAFLRDVLAALAGARELTEIVVVSTDAAIRGPALAAGASFLPEAQPAGLNPAARSGLLHARAGQRVLVVAADLPCLDAASVDHVLASAEARDRSFVCDSVGTGTTMLLTAEPRRCEPMFGERSRARHAAAGYVELGPSTLDGRVDAASTAAFSRARRDVDTAVDLWDARRIGLGPATRAALRAGSAG